MNIANWWMQISKALESLTECHRQWFHLTQWMLHLKLDANCSLSEMKWSPAPSACPASCLFCLECLSNGRGSNYKLRPLGALARIVTRHSVLCAQIEIAIESIIDEATAM